MSDTVKYGNNPVIFNMSESANRIFAMRQYCDWPMNTDILHLLCFVKKVGVVDDKLAQRIYLGRFPIVNADQLSDEDLARLSKVNVKNIRALYVKTILECFDMILAYFRYISEHDFRFTIPCKLESKFKEYLNIAVKYNIEHASEAFDNFAISLMSPLPCDDYMFVSESDMNMLLNRSKKLIDILANKAKDPISNFFSFGELKTIICKRFCALCRMAIPVFRSFEFHDLKQLKKEFGKELLHPAFKLNSTSDIDDRFTLDHAFMMDHYIDTPRIGYTEDAALFSVLRDSVFANINELIKGKKDEIGQPDTSSYK